MGLLCFRVMQVSLHTILSHKSFSWQSRLTQANLLQNMEMVVKEITRIERVATNSSSMLYKAMVKLYNLTRKPKNVRQGLETFMKVESEVLNSYMLVFGGEEENEKSTKRRRCSKRKSYAELKTVRLKKARVTKVMEVIKEDADLGEDVFEHLKMEKQDSCDKDVTSEAFKICCLSLMKTLRLSDTKYNDLRWWIEDVINRGFDLASMPTARSLKKKVKEEMVPPNMETCETGAKFELQDALFHTGKRFVQCSL